MSRVGDLVRSPARRIGSWWSGLPRNWRYGGVAAVVVLALTGGILDVVTSGTPQITVTAEFSETPGLYVGNAVEVLGIPVGHIISIKAGPASVAVRMHVNASVKLPANVGAFLMAPNVVNDRYVQLDPAYTSGPQLTSGALIPNNHTAVPVSVDEIIGTLDTLAKALGPEGANASGALSALLHAAAKEFDGQGSALHTTVSSFGQALQALSSNTADVTAVIDNLGNLTKVTSQATGEYQAFAGDLATVSAALNGDSTSIKTALSTLQLALAQVATFVHNNFQNLGASVTNLENIAGTLAQQQKALGQLFSASPLALQNVAAAYDPKAPDPASPTGTAPALRGRLDMTPGSGAFAQSVCGNSVLRLLVVSLDLREGLKDPIPGVDLACGVSYALQTLPLPPGGQGPNLSLRGLLAAGA